MCASLKDIIQIIATLQTVLRYLITKHESNKNKWFNDEPTKIRKGKKVMKNHDDATSISVYRGKTPGNELIYY